MDPASREDTKLLIDIDAEDDEEAIRKNLTVLNVWIRLDYPTKNGRHIITEPFNPALVPVAEIKKDGLLLFAS